MWCCDGNSSLYCRPEGVASLGPLLGGVTLLLSVVTSSHWDQLLEDHPRHSAASQGQLQVCTKFTGVYYGSLEYTMVHWSIL